MDSVVQDNLGNNIYISKKKGELCETIFRGVHHFLEPSRVPANALVDFHCVPEFRRGWAEIQKPFLFNFHFFLFLLMFCPFCSTSCLSSFSIVPSFIELFDVLQND